MGIVMGIVMGKDLRQQRLNMLQAQHPACTAQHPLQPTLQV